MKNQRKACGFTLTGKHRTSQQASVQKKGQVAGLVLFFSADVDIVSGQGVTSNFKVSCPCSAHFCNGKF